MITTASVLINFLTYDYVYATSTPLSISSTTAPNFVTARLNAAKLDYAQRVNEITMMPSFSPSPALPFCGHQPAVQVTRRTICCRARPFMILLSQRISSHSRQTDSDLIKYSSSRLLFRDVAVAMSPPSVCYVLHNSDQVDRGGNTGNFYPSQDRQAARSKHEEKRPENSDGRKGAA